MHTVHARYIDGQVVFDADQSVPEQNCRILVVFLEPGSDAVDVPQVPPPAEYLTAVHQFTKRELDILRLLCTGMSNKEIAQELEIHHGTVRNYTSRIYHKLEVTSRTEAVIRATELGIHPDALF